MEKIISNIVFTKNRPLQLHAYLESLYRFLPAELIQTYIIYKVELFKQQYEQLFQQFPACVVVKEKDFHSDFLKVVNQVETQFTLFGIDDVVYFNPINFDSVDAAFREYSDEVFGFTFRFGPPIFKDTGDVVENTEISGEQLHRLNWKKGQTPVSRYPFELCSTIYKTELVKKILCGTMNNNQLMKTLFSPGSFLTRAMSKIFSTRSTLKSFGYFFSPNTLESWNCRWCKKNAEKLPSFFYFHNQCAVAIQVNMVNTSTQNISCGSEEHTVEALAEKYKQGFRLDIDFVTKNNPVGIHCGPECFRLTRRNE